MKKTALILILMCFIYITGCDKKEDKKEEKTETLNKPQETTTPPAPTVTTPTEKKEEVNKTAEEKKSPEKKESLRDKSGAIRVNFPAGSNEILLNGKINGFADKITYVVDAKQGQGLFARVIANYTNKNPNPNVYIDQIISPSGKADGPIGIKTLREYRITESGDWKIVIAESQMADAWKGEYTLQIVIR